MRTYLFLLSVFLLLVFPSALQSVTINVPGDQPTIQAGIDACADGDTVLVADGTYTGDGNRDIDFTGKAIVLMSENGPQATIIDCGGSEVDHHRGFYFHSGEEASSVVQGFTITNGFEGLGGGLDNYRSNPTFANCTFSGNRASSGGGMYIYYSNPTFTNCTFSGNTAGNYGGGIYNFGAGPKFTDCSFSDNWVTYTFGYGGGMYNYEGSSPNVTNCTFSGNWAEGGGGGMYNDRSSPTVTSCMFIGNEATNLYGLGGGMYNDSWSNPTVTNCTFSENSAGYGDGGGMYNTWFSSPTVTNCILWGDFGGEILNGDFSDPIVTYSDVQGGYPGEGNIDANPLFFTLGEFESFLDAGSPCIDAGGPQFNSYNNPTSDGISDWHPRWPDWIPNGPRPDMGAYGGPGNVGWLQ